MFRGNTWTVDIPPSNFSCKIRSSTDGYCFQPSLGVAHVVVRHLFPPQTLHSVHVYEIPLSRMVTFLIALLTLCFSISLAFTIVVLVGIVSALLPAFTVWRFRVAKGRSGDDDVRKSSLVGWRRRRTCGTLFKRVKDFNPFRTRRVPRDDRISLSSRLSEGRV